jgi:RNA polymerase sigma factor (TIGR02999 family)
MGELTELMAAARRGQADVVDRIVELTYRELHGIAHQRLRYAPKVTHLDTTALVHECYLRLVKLGELNTVDRAHFLSYAARVMRSIIVDLAREQLAERRGGDVRRVPMITDIPIAAPEGELEVIRVDEALQEVARLDPRLVQVVEMKYFAGMTNDEIASALDLNEKTVRRDWEKARVLLHEQLKN